eukprot:jgi/Astpho2/2938/fgenesh1_pg.00050_%23_172_t
MQSETPKPTEGSEYTFARKQSVASLDRKDLAHIWEISGSQDLAALIAEGDHLFLGPLQVATATVVITADLGRPAEVLPTVLFWLDQVQRKLAATYASLERRGSKLPEQLRLRARRYFGSQHDDADLVQHTGVAIVIAALKDDTFRSSDAEVRKVLACSLRHVAHSHGASLVFLGGLAGGAAIHKEGAADKALLANFRAMLNHLVFTGLDKRMALRMECQTDHLQSLVVPGGADRFRDIGRPRGGAAGATPAAALAEWQGLCEQVFPPKPPDAKRHFDAAKQQYAEREVDETRKQRDAELEAQQKDKTAQQASALKARKSALIARQQMAQRRRTGSSKALQP